MPNYKVVDADELDATFTSIADSIRAKTGGTEPIKSGDIPQELGKIKSINELIDRSISGEVVLPEGVTTLYNYMFTDCINITKIVLPNTITKIGERTFANTGIGNDFRFPQTSHKIKTNMRMFSGCKNLTELIVPSNLEFFQYEFSGIPNLKTVIVETGVTGLSNYMFCDAKLTTISLPNTITSMGYWAFGRCTELEFVTLEQGFLWDLDIHWSTKYSVETLVAMFEAYADLTGQETRTLTIGVENIEKLTEEQIAIATEKNVTVA